MTINSIEDVGFLMDKLGIPYSFDEDKTSIFTYIVNEGETPTSIMMDIVGNHWLYVSAILLTEKPVTEDEKLCLFYKSLLIENNYTKMGRFFIDEEGGIRFGTDLLLSTVNEELLEASISTILYAVENRLPEIGAPYVDLLFSTST